MAPSHDFTDPDVFTTGTVGPPGRRVFYLQAREGAELLTLRLEKQQVALLAEHLARILSDLPPPATVASAAELVEPVDAAWTVGQIGLGSDVDADRILVVVHELTESDFAAADDVDEDEVADLLADVLSEVLRDEGDDDDLDEALGLLDTGEGATARFLLTRAQGAAFVARAADVVAGGRPRCFLCGGPIDPEGHVCPRTNGHKPH